MKTTGLTVFFIILFDILTWGQNSTVIALTGSVFEAGKGPLAGCQVILEGSFTGDTETLTDADGRFSLSAADVKPFHDAAPEPEIQIINNQLSVFSSRSTSNITFKLRDVKGTALTTLFSGRLNQGRNTFDLESVGNGMPASGLYILELSGNELHRSMPVMLLPDGNIQMITAGTPRNSTPSLSKAAANEDLLAVRCQGFLTKRMPVSDLAGSPVTVTLKRPNVLLLMADDMNEWTTMTNGWVHTPHLEALAESGVYFRRAHAAAMECNPSRTSLLTGLLPSSSGMYRNPMWFRDWPKTKDLETIPQYLQKLGYETVNVGKIFHKAQGKESDSVSWHSQVPYSSTNVPDALRSNLWHNNDFLNLYDDTYNNGAFVFGPTADPRENQGDYRGAKFTADYVRAAQDKPFFLACGNFRPHTPLVAPQEYFDLYPLDEIEIPQIIQNDLEDVGTTAKNFAHNNNRPAHDIVLKYGVWKEAVQAYKACASFVDDNMGMILDALDEGPHRDNTIVIFLSDHGVHLGQKEHWWKRTLWNETTHIPMIWRVPGLTPQGSISPRTVSSIDIYPTLLDLLNLPAKESLDGRSLIPLLKDPQKEWPYAALTTCLYGNHSVVTEEYRYTRYVDGFEELYDHRLDSLEFHNIAGKPENKGVIDELTQWLPAVDEPDPGK